MYGLRPGRIDTPAPIFHGNSTITTNIWERKKNKPPRERKAAECFPGLESFQRVSWVVVAWRAWVAKKAERVQMAQSGRGNTEHYIEKKNMQKKNIESSSTPVVLVQLHVCSFQNRFSLQVEAINIAALSDARVVYIVLAWPQTVLYVVCFDALFLGCRRWEFQDRLTNSIQDETQ